MQATNRIEFDEPENEASAGDDLGVTLREVAHMAEAELREQMEQRPYVTLAVAFGTGYVLGGGIPRFVARAMAAMAMRYAAGQVIRQIVPPSSREG